MDWWNGFEQYDRVYMSKVFTFTPDFDTAINAEEIVTGGTGYKDFGSVPPEIKACPPDYTIYPQWKSAVGFLTRGCVRHCEFCIVPRNTVSSFLSGAIQQFSRMGQNLGQKGQPKINLRKKYRNQTKLR